MNTKNQIIQASRFVTATLKLMQRIAIDTIPGEENIPADVFSRLVHNPINTIHNQIFVLQCTDDQRTMIKENHEWLHDYTLGSTEPYYT